MLSFIRLALVMVSVHSSKTLTKTEVSTRDWGIAVIGLTMFCLEECGFGDFWIWKAMECFKWGFLAHPSRNMDDFVTENTLNCAVLTQEISEERISVCGIKTVLVVFW